MRILNFKAFFLTDIFVLINFDENWILAGYFYYVFYSKIPRPNGHRGLLSLRESIFGREPVFRKLGASFQKLAPYYFENQPVSKNWEPVLKKWPFQKIETLGKCIFCHAKIEIEKVTSGIQNFEIEEVTSGIRNFSPFNISLERY